jgi:hypothetical protein
MDEGTGRRGVVMSVAGWFFMGISVFLTTGGFLWCVWKVLKTPESSDRMHGVLDTERRVESEDRPD